MAGVNNEMITVSEAAERKGCHRSWIHHLIEKGRLKATRIGPVYLIRVRDLEACKVRPREKPDSNGQTSSLPQKRTSGIKRSPATTAAKSKASKRSR